MNWRTQGTTTILAVTLVLWSQMSSGAERLVGLVPADGGGALVKSFAVPGGTTITGVQFESNGGTHPMVRLVRDAGSTLSEGVAVTMVTNVAASPGTVSVDWPAPVEVAEAASYSVVISMSAATRLGANSASAPGGSYIAAGDEIPLVPIRGDLAVELVTSLGAGTCKARPIEPDSEVRRETYLRGALPNPLAAGMSIEFGLERTMQASLTIYDVAGRKVRRVFKGEAGPGVHIVTWDGREEAGPRAARGIYLLELLAGDRILTTRLVVTR
jgi:hypothetical protein